MGAVTWDHNPGSPEAVEQGCLCAVLDNYHGAGFPWDGKTAWWITGGCPLHTEQWEDEAE
jgi:hypothetical protein